MISERETLRSDLKTARKKFGKDSSRVFKIIKRLKELSLSKEDVESWEHYALGASFGGRCNN
jgi:hypothetical protein